MSALLLAVALGAVVVAGIVGGLMGLSWIVIGPEEQARYRMAVVLLVFWAAAAVGVYLAIVDSRGAA